MTDEEKARDYAEHKQGKYTNEFGNLYQAYLAGLEYNNKQIAELEEKIKVKKLEILELKSQIKKMKCDVIFLIKDRMNDDIDQNIIERLAEKWEIKE